MALRVIQEFHHLANKHKITGKRKKKFARFYWQMYNNKNLPTSKLTLGIRLKVLLFKAEEFLIQERAKLQNANISRGVM